MKYCKNYCEDKGISTSKLNEAQRTLYYIAENMKMNKSINKEGYKHFQMAIKALEQEIVLDKISAEIEALTNGAKPEHIWNVDVLAIINKYKTKSEE